MKFTRLCAAALAAVLVFAAPAPALADVSATPSSSYPQFDEAVWAIAHRGDVVYVGGEFAQVTDSGGATFTRRGAAAFDAVTGEVLPWNPDVNGPVLALVTTRQGVFLGGRFSVVDGQSRRNLARVSLRGAGPVSATFKRGANRPVRALAAGHGRLYVGGGFSRLAGRPRAHLAAVRTEAPFRVTSWAPQAKGGGVDDIVSTPSGVFVAGTFTRMAGRTKYDHLALVRADTGRLIPSFRHELRYAVQDIAIGDRRVYAAVAGPGGHVFSLDRRTGATRWSHWTDGDAQAIELVRNVVYVGGHFNRVCDSARSGVAGSCRGSIWEGRKRAAAFTTSGRLKSWNPSGNSIWGVRVLDHLPGQDALVAGGHVTEWNGGTVEADRLAVFGPDSAS